MKKLLLGFCFLVFLLESCKAPCYLNTETADIVIEGSAKITSVSVAVDTGSGNTSGRAIYSYNLPTPVTVYSLNDILINTKVDIRVKTTDFRDDFLLKVEADDWKKHKKLWFISRIR